MAAYKKFAGMILVSYFVMFGLMYLNTYEPGHVLFSQTRAYMALLMVAAMAPVMLIFMPGMFKSKILNRVILTGSAFAFAIALWLVRSQATVSDISWMKAMIPHHSIAILTSERAEITDSRVRKLADEIIEAQRREIAEMKILLEDLNRGK